MKRKAAGLFLVAFTLWAFMTIFAHYCMGAKWSESALYNGYATVLIFACGCLAKL